MDLLPTAINAAVLAAVGLILGWLGKGRIDRLDRELADLRAEMNQRFGEVHTRIDRLEERMEVRFDSVRSDLTRVALAVGVRPETEAGR